MKNIVIKANRLNSRVLSNQNKPLNAIKWELENSLDDMLKLLKKYNKIHSKILHINNKSYRLARAIINHKQADQSINNIKQKDIDYLFFILQQPNSLKAKVLKQLARLYTKSNNTISFLEFVKIYIAIDDLELLEYILKNIKGELFMEVKKDKNGLVKLKNAANNSLAIFKDSTALSKVRQISKKARNEIISFTQSKEFKSGLAKAKEGSVDVLKSCGNTALAVGSVLGTVSMVAIESLGDVIKSVPDRLLTVTEKDIIPFKETAPKYEYHEETKENDDIKKIFQFGVLVAGAFVLGAGVGSMLGGGSDADDIE